MLRKPRTFTPTGSAKAALSKTMLQRGHDAKHQKCATGLDCSVCRKSETRIVGKRFAIVCTLNLVMDATKCGEFKDARRPLTLPPLMAP